MSDSQLRRLSEAQEYFRLPSLGLVEKDQFVVQAIAALALLDAAPFRLVFGRGTALARAHRLIKRMSEDVDFKVMPLSKDQPMSKSALRKSLSGLKQKVTSALQAAHFAFDPKNSEHTKSLNENRYTIWRLPYTGIAEAGEGLRAAIQIELTYAPLRLAPVELPVSSFVAEAYSEQAEVPKVPCVSVTETAAEKLVALTRRTAMQLAGLARDPDHTLVRHIYDLNLLRNHVEDDHVAELARSIAQYDAIEFQSQYPEYAANVAGETRKALEALENNPVYRLQYDNFVAVMVYGDKPGFDIALDTVRTLVTKAFEAGNVSVAAGL